MKKDKGYIVAFSFGKGAQEEVAEAKQRRLHIDLLTVDKLLEYEDQNMKSLQDKGKYFSQKKGMKKRKKLIKKDYKMPHLYKGDLEEIIEILEEANFKKYEIKTDENE